MYIYTVEYTNFILLICSWSNFCKCCSTCKLLADDFCAISQDLNDDAVEVLEHDEAVFAVELGNDENERFTANFSKRK